MCDQLAPPKPSVIFLTESERGEGLCFGSFSVESDIEDLTVAWPAVPNKDGLFAQ